MSGEPGGSSQHMVADMANGSNSSVITKLNLERLNEYDYYRDGGREAGCTLTRKT